MAFSANSFRTSTLLISKDTDHSPLPFFFSICTFSCTVVTHLEHLSSSSTRFKLLSNRKNLKKEGHKRKPFLLKFSFFHRIILKQKKKKKKRKNQERHRRRERKTRGARFISKYIYLFYYHYESSSRIARRSSAVPYFFLSSLFFIHFFQQFFSLFCFCFVHSAREKGTE